MATASKDTREKTTPKSGTAGSNRSKDLDFIRKNLAKRSYHVKFDLDNTGYQPIEKIGIGAYGVVCSAIHKKSAEKVAIKKISCVFEALAIAKRTYREIKILKHFKHDNIISIREILKPKESYDDFKDIYVVFDLMESDLHRIIYSEQPLTEEHIRYFLYQILRGLKYIHSANVVHRDLKPSNLLVNEDCHVRIGDFGMARGVNSQPEEASHYMTQYVATRWYRAPEILLSLLEYGTAVDMWSVGCIFGEMLGRKHLFPGKDYLTQVKLVLGLLGTPSEEILKNCQNDPLRRIIKSFGHRQPMSWSTLFPKASRKALDLLGRMLVMDPAQRVTVDRALQHPFLTKYHDPDDEPICVPSFEFDFEKELVHMEREELRDVIYKEILEFHQPRTPNLFPAFLRPVPKPDEASDNSSKDASMISSPSSPFKDQLQAVMSNMAAARPEPEGKGDSTLLQQSGLVSAVHESGGSIALPQKGAVARQPGAESVSSQHGEDLFKRPGEKAGPKQLPVSVETTNLRLPCAGDVEMLSAQSTDGSKAMDTQAPRTPLVEKQDHKKEGKSGDKKTENKTISEDTKALVKQALLSHRQRTESCGDDDKPRPVTAAQRQREREEKRKKKRESKMKKMQEKKTAPPAAELSAADRELLARWSNMQGRPESNKAGAKPQTAASPSSTPSTTAPAGLSPPHPGPTTTPPTILPAGVLSQRPVAILPAPLPLPQGQVTVTQGQGHGHIVIPQGQIAVAQGRGHGQIVLPQGQVVGFAVNPAGLGIQGQATGQQGQGVISVVDLHRHSGGQLQITETQAQALKEALKMSQTSTHQLDRRDSGGGGGDATAAATAFPNQVHSPPNPAAVTGAGDFTTIQTRRDSGSPSSVLQQSPHAARDFHASPEPISQNLFSQSPAGQSQTFTPHLSPAQQPREVSHSPQHPQNLHEFFERHCQSPEMSSNGKPASMVNSSLPGFQAGSFPAASSTGGVCFPPQSQVGGQIPHPAQPYFLSSHANSAFNASSQQVPGPSDFSFPDPSAVDSSNHASLPFSRYAGAASGIPGMDSVKEGAMVQGNFGMDSLSSHHPMSQGSMVHPSMISHQGLMGAGSNLAPSSDHGTEVRPSGGFAHQPVFQSSLPMQTSLSSSSGSQFPPQSQHTPPPQLHQPSLSPHHHHHGDPHQTHHQDPHQSHHQDPHQTHHQDPHQTHHGDPHQTHHGDPHQTHHGDPHQTHHHHVPQHLEHHHPGPSNDPQSSSSAQLSTASGESKRQGPNLRVSAPKPAEGVDLVALLSNKLSSIFPPSLSLTPRGTGAGYGVGMDLDVLMADTADANNSRYAELSPLSSSLLADWLDVSENICQADLDALEQDFGMTSPMAMSYTEFTPTSNSSNNDNSGGGDTNWG